MGSGTTGIAALNNKRQFIGIEIDQHTFEKARANIITSSTSTAIPTVETMKDKVFAA
jgi:DNA modification methylase